MIDYIVGKITHITQKSITVEAGPIGVSIAVPNSAQFQMGSVVKLYMHLHWNQEQGPALYGFVHEAERIVFLLVTSCSGIGPKIALATLSVLSPQQFLIAIQSENPDLLSQVPGIGTKKAEQIIVQLKHKVADVLADLPLDDVSLHRRIDWTTLSQALTSLNYSRTEVSAALHHVRQKQADAQVASFDVLLRQALSFLAKQV